MLSGGSPELFSGSKHDGVERRFSRACLRIELTVMVSGGSPEFI